MKSEKKYLEQLFGQKIIASVKLNAGVLSDITKITLENNSSFYVKKSLPAPEVKGNISNLFKAISANRIRDEEKTIRLLYPLFNKSKVLKIPKMVHFDKKINLLVTLDTKPEFSLEKTLIVGDMSPTVSSLLGRTIAKLQSTRNVQHGFIRANHKRDMRQWHSLLRLRTVSLVDQNELNPEFNKLISKTYEEGLSNASDCFIHMDYCPKNIGYSKGRIHLYDFELSSFVGDPLFDLGFMIGHYLLFSLNQSPLLILKCANSMIESYYKESNALARDCASVDMIWKYAWCTVVYRLKGASKVKYINKRDEKALLQLAQESMKEIFNH